MTNIFHTCVGLESIKMRQNFDVSKVTAKSTMFAWCNKKPVVSSTLATKNALYNSTTKATTYVSEWNVL